MPTASADISQASSTRLRLMIGLVVLQVLAAAFFVADSLFDAEFAQSGEAPSLTWMEVGVALALLAGIVVCAAIMRRLTIEARDREQVIAMAQGAFAEVVAQRFGEWKLSAAETDVGMFALKGCSIAEIARMRGSAEGTVRAQLSQVYAKAGVTSQPMFVALFVEDLLG